MPYPPQLVDPMRAELTQLGVEELRSAAAVDALMQEASDETVAVIINSVCGCAAANARPAIRLARHAPGQPDRYVTVFAGQDLEATAQMREYLPGIPPSSPFIALLKNGQPVFILERRHIEGRTAGAIAHDLAEAYREYGTESSGDVTVDTSEQKNDGDSSEGNGMPDSFRSIL